MTLSRDELEALRALADRAQGRQIGALLALSSALDPDTVRALLDAAARAEQHDAQAAETIRGLQARLEVAEQALAREKHDRRAEVNELIRDYEREARDAFAQGKQDGYEVGLDEGMHR